MKKNSIIVLLLMMLTPVLDACQPLKEGYGIDNPGQYSRVYIAASYNGLQHKAIAANENIDVPVYANYAGVIDLKSDLTVQFVTDLTLVSLYNSRNGTSFKAMPEPCFRLEPSSAVIPAGATSSREPACIRILAEAFTDASEYLLPVRIASLSDPSVLVNSELGTMFLSVVCHAPDLEISVKPLADYNVSPVENW